MAFFRRLSCLALTAAVVVLAAQGQVAGTTGQSDNAPQACASRGVASVPDDRAYWHFVQQIGHQDAEVQRQIALADPSHLYVDKRVARYSKLLGLHKDETRAMMNILRDAYQADRSNFRQYAQAMAEYQQRPGSAPTRPGDLMEQNQADLTRTIARLHGELGDESFNKVNAYVQRQWGEAQATASSCTARSGSF